MAENRDSRLTVPPVCCTLQKKKNEKKISGIAGTAGTPVRPRNLADFRSKRGVFLYRTCTGTIFKTVPPSAWVIGDSNFFLYVYFFLESRT